MVPPLLTLSEGPQGFRAMGGHGSGQAGLGAMVGKQGRARWGARRGARCGGQEGEGGVAGKKGVVQWARRGTHSGR
jgi:hypothetical protein